MGGPSLEEFRRWLQTEIREIEALDSDSLLAKRLIQLESSLQEAMAFTAAWEMRAESEIVPVIQEKSVRLISSSDEFTNKSVKSSGTCPSCEDEIDEDLPFCPACGENL
jgi:hypothetical protein